MGLERRWSRRRRGEGRGGRDRKENGRRWEKEEKVIEGKRKEEEKNKEDYKVEGR